MIPLKAVYKLCLITYLLINTLSGLKSESISQKNHFFRIFQVEETNTLALDFGSEY